LVPATERFTNGDDAVAKKTDQEGKHIAVKIERDIVTRARMVAANEGLTLADYVSKTLRVVVDRDWSKLVRKAGDETGSK
jgi:hypothetical protein